MSQNIAAGLLMYRCRDTDPEFFLVHPGGPFFKHKDRGVWTIPKGLPHSADVDLLATAQREFQEETGLTPRPPFHPLGSIQQKSGKLVHAWAFQGEWDPAVGIISNNFRIEWPPRSGRLQEFPESDRASWMSYDDAARYIVPAQRPFLDRAKQFV